MLVCLVAVGLLVERICSVVCSVVCSRVFDASQGEMNRS